MILLDTDHVTLLKYHSSERGQRLAQRLDELPPDEIAAVTVITIEEQMRGWLAAVAKERSSKRQVGPYRELAELFALTRYRLTTIAGSSIVDAAHIHQFEVAARIVVAAYDEQPWVAALHGQDQIVQLFEIVVVV